MTAQTKWVVVYDKDFTPLSRRELKARLKKHYDSGKNEPPVFYGGDLLERDFLEFFTENELVKYVQYWQERGYFSTSGPLRQNSRYS